MHNMSYASVCRRTAGFVASDIRSVCGEFANDHCDVSEHCSVLADKFPRSDWYALVGGWNDRKQLADPAK